MERAGTLWLRVKRSGSQLYHRKASWKNCHVAEARKAKAVTKQGIGDKGSLRNQDSRWGGGEERGDAGKSLVYQACEWVKQTLRTHEACQILVALTSAFQVVETQQASVCLCLLCTGICRMK